MSGTAAAGGAAPGWAWATKCRLLGGQPTRELFDEAVAAGDACVPILVDILSRREFREGEPPDCGPLTVHALRILGHLRAESALPALLNVLCDPVDPAQYGEEAALALARVGDVALPALEGVLFDARRDTWIRAGAGRALLLSALADRRRRRRVRAAFERIFLDPREGDRMLLAQLACSAALMAAGPLLPAIETAFRGGRVDESVIDMDSLRVESWSRRHRLDQETKALVRHDVSLDLPTWRELMDELGPAFEERTSAQFERIEREGAGPPDSEADAALYELDGDQG